MLTRTSVLLLFLGLAACGARADLGLQGGGSSSGSSASAGGSGGGPGGSGGTGGGSGGTGGTGGGSGGSAGACDGLVLIAPIIEVLRPAGHADESPALARSSDDGEQITVAFQRRDTTIAGAPRMAVHASLRPWQSWPSGPLSPTYTTFVSTQLDPTFAVGGGFGERFALLVSHASTIESFAPAADPNAPDAGPNLTLSSQGLPVFVARGTGGRHLVADSNGHMLQGHVVDFTGGSFDVKDLLLACGGDASVADAVAYEDGWLVALGNEKTAQPGDCSAAANGPMRLDVLFVGPDGSITPVTTLDEGAPIVRISVAPHPDGAYVVWQVASGGAVAPIRSLRVDAAGGSVIGPSNVSGPGAAPFGVFDAAAIGDRLAVAWRNDPANNAPDLTLTVLDPTGAKVTETFIEPPFGTLSIAGGPGGAGVVVSWQEPGTVVKLARFDCVGGL